MVDNSHPPLCCITQLHVMHYSASFNGYTRRLPRKVSGPFGHGVKNTYELLNLRAFKFSPVNKSTSFNVWVRYFVRNFKEYLWNSTQNILPILWHIRFLYKIEILRALRFQYRQTVFEDGVNNPIVLKCCTDTVVSQPCSEQNFKMIR